MSRPLSFDPVRFEWDRFWYEHGQPLQLSDGYLVDPGDEYGGIVNPSGRTLADMHEIHFMALLGEPGIGKTWTIQEHVQQLEAQDDSLAVRLVLLGDYPAYPLLDQNLFQRQDFQAWRTGSGRLYLFLDGLDECMLELRQVGAWLSATFENLDAAARERLYLRIACRPAVWPAGLEDRLSRLWPASSAVFSLAPLRRRDVAVAARQRGIDPDAFLVAVDERELGPLASRPSALSFLLGGFAAGTLPGSKAEAYAAGCLRLCEERDPRRWDAGRLGRLDGRQRLAVAGRIAALSLLANKPVIRRDSSVSGAQTSELSVVEIIGGWERTETGEVVVDMVDRDAVTEVLDTGLFQAAGPGRLRFAHRTYAEFLASRHLATHLDPRTILALVCSPGPTPKVIPQLAEVVAWLVAEVAQLFDIIIDRDPEVLLASDVATRQPADRARLAETLLRRQEHQPAPRVAPEQLGKLAYDGLADLVRAWLIDPAKPVAARRLAAAMAGATDPGSLVEPLTRLALDNALPLDLRGQALDALSGADPSTLSQLQLLAQGVPEDEDDELKGIVLRLLWPSVLSTDEVFNLVTSPRNDALIGSYYSFLESFATSLDNPDLASALAWAAKAAADLSGWALMMAIDILITRALARLDEQSMADAVAPALLTRLVHGEELGRPSRLGAALDQVIAQTDRRRMLLRALARPAARHGAGVARVSYAVSRLGRMEDFRWICELVCDPTATEAEREGLAHIARLHVCTRRFSPHGGIVAGACVLVDAQRAARLGQARQGRSELQ